jgi:hypothetical protein
MSKGDLQKLNGRLLIQTTAEIAPNALALALRHPRSGVVVTGRAAAHSLPRRANGVELFDADAWRGTQATTENPTSLAPSGGLFETTLDDWAASVVGTRSCAAVLTPSRRVAAGDFAALAAVVGFGATAMRSNVVTHVVTDAAMLHKSHFAMFVNTVKAERRGRPLAFTFTHSNGAFDTIERVRAARRLWEIFPSAGLLAAEPLMATDALTHGAGFASVGYLSSLRKPSPKVGGMNSAGFLPGTYLPELMEMRSPDVYLDWYTGMAPPWCSTCNRRLDVFGHSDAEKCAIGMHNVHAWLDLFDDVCRANTTLRRSARLDWLRVTALSNHLALRPAAGEVEANKPLRWLVEMDDPMGRRSTARGQLV